uniref:Glycosyl transferase family 25 domain-containing protein n=1 Tax=Alexandrium catenella TaxID=2925 RepID=A0A7S1QQQ8_ALECA
MERLPAVDGHTLSWPQLVADRLFSMRAFVAATKAEAEKRATIGPSPELCSPHLTLGGCGCALSHRRAWQRLVDSQRSWALILEDDVAKMCEDFDGELDRVLEDLPEGWKLCYLGFHTGSLLPRGAHFRGPLIRLDEGGAWLAGLWAYLISRPWAQTLLERTFPMDVQVDTAVGLLGAEEKGIYAVPPNEFLLFSPTTERSRDTDVQTFPGRVRPKCDG